MTAFTPRQRMVNAYRGLFSDRAPVAPEFWYLLPAKLLGVSMVEFEREVPFWQALQTTFTHYGCEGWGIAFPLTSHPDAEKRVSFEKITGNQYRETTVTKFRGRRLSTEKIFDDQEPSWLSKHLADSPSDLPDCLNLLLAPETVFDFTEMNRGHREVGEDYLLEVLGWAPPSSTSLPKYSGLRRPSCTSPMPMTPNLQQSGIVMQSSSAA